MLRALGCAAEAEFRASSIERESLVHKQCIMTKFGMSIAIAGASGAAISRTITTPSVLYSAVSVPWETEKVRARRTSAASTILTRLCFKWSTECHYQSKGRGREKHK